MQRMGRARIPDTGPVVLVLGDFVHEGLTAKIESLGLAVVNKNLRSTPRNWLSIARTIAELAEQGRLALVVAYLPSPTVLMVAGEEYDEVRWELVRELGRAQALLFVFEDNLRGVIEPMPWDIVDPDEANAREADLRRHLHLAQDDPWPTTYRTPFYGTTREQWVDAHATKINRAVAMLDEWQRLGLEILPFRKRSDVTLRIFEALEDLQAGVFLRLYVPHGRYQSEQFEDFLTLFSRYLRDVERKQFSIDTQRTSRGTTYVFKGRGEASTLEDLRSATKRFDEFLTIAETDPAAAERTLVAAGSSRSDAAFVVAKYVRNHQRLQLDSRHEFERRSLLLTQGLEAELLELGPSGQLVQPNERPSSLFAIIGNSGAVTVNVGPGGLAQDSVVAMERLAGGAEYTAEDREILSLVAQVRDELLALELRSTLDRLKDPATPPDDRRTAAQRLKAFVIRAGRVAGKKIDKVATDVLVAYLSAQVTASSR